MASQFARRRFSTANKAKAATRFERAALPGAVVDAVLRFHDESRDQGSGNTLLRLSDKRLHDADVEAALGDLTDRAGRVSILWNERESQIIRVLEAA
jgi:hypothetical protein